jgi:hypothetical protein
LRISSYFRQPFLIYDFATAPFWISLYCIWGKFYLFLSVHIPLYFFTFSSLSLSTLFSLFSAYTVNLCLYREENPIYVLPEKKLRGLSSNFHIHVSVSDLYVPTISLPNFLQQNRQTDRGGIHYINRSQKHECRKWDWGRAVSFLGIVVSNFRYTVFAVWSGIKP